MAFSPFLPIHKLARLPLLNLGLQRGRLRIGGRSLTAAFAKLVQSRELGTVKQRGSVSTWLGKHIYGHKALCCNGQCDSVDSVRCTILRQLVSRRIASSGSQWGQLAATGEHFSAPQ